MKRVPANLQVEASKSCGEARVSDVMSGSKYERQSAFRVWILRWWGGRLLIGTRFGLLVARIGWQGNDIGWQIKIYGKVVDWQDSTTALCRWKFLGVG